VALSGSWRPHLKFRRLICRKQNSLPDFAQQAPERLRLPCASNAAPNHTAESDMSKGLDSKKSDKKKPAKTMKEKKPAKQEKKKNSK
jgi:hypothetical protein